MFPRHVARYELLLPIGTGATATVYLARTRVVGDVYRNVALKLLHPHLREEMSADLLDEARIVAGIRHPHVVSVIEAGVDEHGTYLALEYIEGETLAHLARHAPNRRLPLPLTARIVSDMLDGLHAAHEHRDGAGRPTRLVHRDLSARNVLVGIDGVSRLTDFGIAKLAGRGARTKTGYAKGTVPYMSPEQALGKPLDRRSDVWAAGVVVWEMLTGARLFDGDNETSVLLEIVSGGPIPRPSAVRPGLPAELDDAVAFALTRDRDRRCPDALELKRRLLGVLEQVSEVATHREVAAFVEQLAAKSLQARRRAAADVLAERQVTPAASETPNNTESPALVTAKRPAHAARRAWPVLALSVLIAAGFLAWPRAGIELAAIELPQVTLPQPEAIVTLRVSANANIAEIQIGDRVPLVVEPKRALAIPLEPGERGQSLTVRARSVDGRTVSAQAPAGSTALELTFTGSPAVKTKTPPARRPGRGASPYEK